MKKITLLMLMFFTITSQGQNKLLSSIVEYYNGSSWENSSGTNYEYDNNNNLISETYLNWEQGAWQIRGIYTYTYNASNKITEEFVQDWNPSTNMLENVYKGTYTYTNGMPTEIIYYGWTIPNWVFTNKTVISYNVNNSPDSYLSYFWNGVQWDIDERGQLTYNANNKIISEVDQEWIGGQWVNYYKTLYSYDANNKLVTERLAEWDEFNLLWEETYQTDYVLDANGNRISETETDIITNTKSKQEGNYDTSSLMSSFAHPFRDKSGLDYIFEDFPFVNKILSTSRYSFDTATNTYNVTSRTTYNYNSAIILSTEKLEIINTTITVFPNPTASMVNLNFSTAVTIDKVVVIDITGKSVLKQNQNTTQINVEKLTSGLYIIEAFSGNKKFTSKFVKQ